MARPSILSLSLFFMSWFISGFGFQPIRTLFWVYAFLLPVWICAPTVWSCLCVVFFCCVDGFSHITDMVEGPFWRFQKKRNHNNQTEKKEKKERGGSTRPTLRRRDSSSTIKPCGSISRIILGLGEKSSLLNWNLLQWLKQAPCLEAELKLWQVHTKQLPDSRFGSCCSSISI